MAIENIDLSQEIESWKSAVRGKDVRAANVAAFEKIQGTVNDTVQNVNQAAEDSASASHNAQAAVDSIQTAIATATEKAAAAATSATQAAGSQAAADSSKTAAAQSETNAAASAAEARQIAEGFGGFDGTAASVTATDTYGLVVAALGESTTQALIDAIANKVINELVAKSQIINNLLATVPGNALDAVQGKKLMDLYTRLNGEMKQNSFDLENKSAEQTDLNAIYSGVHRYSNRSKNIPSANNGYIIAVKRDSSMLGQIALDDSGTLYSRACVDSSWGSWK
ncbi:Uncharacterised protein [[Clostridium] symbiosum]|nr:pyocin knob domain-containing protein [[Clostridium] symbiosum]SUY56140.1 Uncharacterised protein [[Clostridium] symbiosum]